VLVIAIDCIRLQFTIHISKSMGKADIVEHRSFVINVVLYTCHSEPEVLRMPVASVVLQMKAMGIDDVAAFPFPTPPSR
jgi:hypothetical protein